MKRQRVERDVYGSLEDKAIEYFIETSITNFIKTLCEGLGKNYDRSDLLGFCTESLMLNFSDYIVRETYKELVEEKKQEAESNN